jgi:hypothetical protein
VAGVSYNAKMLKAPTARVAATLVFSVTLVAATTLAAAALKFDAPAGWVSKTPSSSMRVAEFALPHVPADTEDATVTVFFFGSNMGGNVQTNLDRWIGQVAQPDGSSSKDRATSASFTANGLTITTLDVGGTYVAEVTPGSAERFNKPGFRQIAAVIETPGGPYFVKLLGPQATVAKWAESYTGFLKSVRFE